MPQIGNPASAGDLSRRRMQENAFGALWAIALVVTGCLVLNGLSQNARRDECLMRGAALCSDTDVSHRQTQAAADRVGLAAYLKGSRSW
jgi:hypothetical protein